MGFSLPRLFALALCLATAFFSGTARAQQGHVVRPEKVKVGDKIAEIKSDSLKVTLKVERSKEDGRYLKLTVLADDGSETSDTFTVEIDSIPIPGLGAALPLVGNYSSSRSAKQISITLHIQRLTDKEVRSAMFDPKLRRSLVVEKTGSGGVQNNVNWDTGVSLGPIQVFWGKSDTTKTDSPVRSPMALYFDSKPQKDSEIEGETVKELLERHSHELATAAVFVLLSAYLDHMAAKTYDSLLACSSREAHDKAIDNLVDHLFHKSETQIWKWLDLAQSAQRPALFLPIPSASDYSEMEPLAQLFYYYLLLYRLDPATNPAQQSAWAFHPFVQHQMWLERVAGEQKRRGCSYAFLETAFALRTAFHFDTDYLNRELIYLYLHDRDLMARQVRESGLRGVPAELWPHPTTERDFNHYGGWKMTQARYFRSAEKKIKNLIKEMGEQGLRGPGEHYTREVESKLGIKGRADYSQRPTFSIPPLNDFKDLVESLKGYRGDFQHRFIEGNKVSTYLLAGSIVPALCSSMEKEDATHVEGLPEADFRRPHWENFVLVAYHRYRNAEGGALAKATEEIADRVRDEIYGPDEGERSERRVSREVFGSESFFKFFCRATAFGAMMAESSDSQGVIPTLKEKARTDETFRRKLKDDCRYAKSWSTDINWPEGALICDGCKKWTVLSDVWTQADNSKLMRTCEELWVKPILSQYQ